MVYQNVTEARFLERPNRFIARVELEGREAVAHVRNTGRCRELLVPGARVYLEKSNSPQRKTAYSLIAVEKGDRLINMDSQAPNRVIAEALAEGWLPGGVTGTVSQLRREVTEGDSRFDFGFLLDGAPVLMEVKGVTLEEGGKTLFPDAPTQRGVKHLKHLASLQRSGRRAAAVFLIQMEGVASFSPNDVTHPAFGEALRDAVAAGVAVSAWASRVSPGGITLGKEVPMVL